MHIVGCGFHPSWQQAGVAQSKILRVPHPSRFCSGWGRSGGYPRPKLLPKYSYPTCTFVILTARRLAVGLGLGRWEYSCPSPRCRAR